MVDLLRQGSQWLQQMRTTHCAGLVEYRRPPIAKSVNATIGKTDYDITSESGLTIKAQTVDYLIQAEELALEPEAGDVIVSDGRRFEVMNLAGEGCWRWCDPYRQTYRIHTKEIGPDP